MCTMVGVFGDLHAALDQVALPLSGPELVELLKLRDRIDALVVAGAGSLDDDCGWQLDGAVSLFGWLRDTAGRGRRDAGRIKAMAHRLAAMPAVSAAWQSGALTTGHVEAIVANVDSATIDLFAEHQSELLPALSQVAP